MSKSPTKPPAMAMVNASTAAIFLPTLTTYPIPLNNIFPMIHNFSTSLTKNGEKTDQFHFFEQFLTRLDHPFVFSIEEEINFLFLHHLLNTGTYTPSPSIDPDDPEKSTPYHLSNEKLTGNILRGVLNFLLDPDLGISLSSLKQISLEEVSLLFDFALSEEYELSPGIYGYQKHPERAVVEEILMILKSSAATLQMLKFDNFYEYFLGVLGNGKSSNIGNKTHSISYLIDEIIKNFPQFNDQTTIEPPNRIGNESDGNSENKSENNNENNQIPNIELCLFSELQMLLYNICWKFGSVFELFHHNFTFLFSNNSLYQPLLAVLEDKYQNFTQMRENDEGLYQLLSLYTANLENKNQNQNKNYFNNNFKPAPFFDTFSPTINYKTVSIFAQNDLHFEDYNVNNINTDPIAILDSELTSGLSYSSSFVLTRVFLAIFLHNTFFPDFPIHNFEQRLQPLFPLYNVNITNQAENDEVDGSQCQFTLLDALSMYLEELLPIIEAENKDAKSHPKRPQSSLLKNENNQEFANKFFNFFSTQYSPLIASQQKDVNPMGCSLFFGLIQYGLETLLEKRNE